jgi:hypothetical protein
MSWRECQASNGYALAMQYQTTMARHFESGRIVQQARQSHERGAPSKKGAVERGEAAAAAAEHAVARRWTRKSTDAFAIPNKVMFLLFFELRR